MISEQQIIRKQTRKIDVGNVPVGGDSPISVQSMTNTLTADSVSTIRQIEQLHEAGADIVEYLFLIKKQLTLFMSSKVSHRFR